MDHLNAMETDVKEELRKTESMAEEMAVEVRSANERVANLGESEGAKACGTSQPISRLLCSLWFRAKLI